ncbi:arrestin-related trafficking adapter 4/5/7, partial [Tremellales sp. Uapishka_1]
MPHWYSGHGHGHGAATPTSSAPPSRPSSPTRQPISRNNSLFPSRDSHDQLGEYFGALGSQSGLSTPAHGSYTSDFMFGHGGAETPGGSYFPHAPVEILLDSDTLVLRGQGGDMNPAYLSGQIQLSLAESTNIKEITMNLTGKAKVHFSDGVGFTHTILTHDWSLLEGNKRHTHTLKAGRHSFPFNYTLDGGLPASGRTFTNDASISYKFRVHVVRSGLSSNWTNTKQFTLLRTFTPEALEFTQTLEIENTWPGKIMYALTLPHKAFAAGDDIPVNIKFMPLAKGVRVLSVSSVIKEYTMVHTRSSSHPESRVAASVKHEIKNGRAFKVDANGETHPPAPHHGPSPSRTPMPPASTRLPTASWGVRPPDSYFPAPAAEPANAVAGSSSSHDLESADEELEVGDDEIDTHLTVSIPSTTTPSHSIHPVFVTHKIKWSCSISNPDGHVSELRCALPIWILDRSLLEEAREAGANTRGLLFGGTGDEAPQIDLPSYSNHVYDRVAVADSGTSSGVVARSVQATPAHSPMSATPPHSRPPSRPGSPTRQISRTSDSGENPPRRQLSQWADSELLLSLGALSTGSNSNPHSGEHSPAETPPDSRGHSRSSSRAGNRSGRSSAGDSRAGSRASSPERPQSSSNPSSYAEDGMHRPIPERRGSGFHNLLHLPSALKPMRPLSTLAKTPILRGPQAGLASPGLPIVRNANSFSNLPASNGITFAPSTSFDQRRPRGFHMDGGPDTPSENDVDPLNQVPSYAVASRGFLGGGIVPISVGLPTYDEAERVERTRSHTDLQNMNTTLPRPRSDSALVQLGAQAAAAAEDAAQREPESLEEVGLGSA